MKIKSFVAGLFLVSALVLSTQFVAGQDEDQGTFVEESGEKQDSTKQASIFDFEGELDEKSSSNTGLIIAIAGVVVIGGGTIFFIRKKKKATG